MARVCQVTGKKRVIGNNVSHSKRRTKREFAPNLKTKRFWSEEEGRYVTLQGYEDHLQERSGGDHQGLPGKRFDQHRLMIYGYGKER